jgi:hypothetical protein
LELGSQPRPIANAPVKSNCQSAFASQDFKKHYNDISQRLTQSITSNAQYYENFDNGSSFSASYGRNQNIIDNTYSQNGRVSYSIPQLQPLRKLLSNESSLPDWLKDIALSYGVNASWVENKSALTDSTTSMKINRVISHSPSILFHRNSAILLSLYDFIFR